jgi:hypothetical protein
MDGDITVQSLNHSELVEKIVTEWNKHVDIVQNNTIKLCLGIKEILKGLDHNTVKEIMNEVKSHPNIKQFVSVDRIWQGMRLIDRRPELIEYVTKPEEERQQIPETKKPYTKKDGEIFWEYYFELEKHGGLNKLERDILEKTGIEEGWTSKKLREEIQVRKDELAQKGDLYLKNQLKNTAIAKCIALLKSMSFDKVLDAEKLLIALSRRDSKE